MPQRPRSVLIEGAGIAGQTLRAELERLGIPVAISDSRTFPRDKVCGGVLQPDSWRYLRDTFGIDCPHAKLDSISHFWRGRRLSCHRLGEPLVFAARLELDHELWRRPASPTAAEAKKNPEALRIIASGARSGTEGAWIGFQADAPPVDGLQMHYGRGIYAGICRTPSGIAHAAFLVRRALYKNPEQMRALVLSELGIRLEGALKGTSRIRYGTSGVGLAVGDAKLTTHPFLGLGMKHAILSARLLARLIAEGREGEYDARHREAFRRMRWASRAGEAIFDTPFKALAWPFLFAGPVFRSAYAWIHKGGEEKP